ncbi:unnamed protein product [Ectocarpus sp. 12 AP-2014]
MGVNTLLKHLGPCLEDSHVERFRGKTVALDGNTFIFRGCYSCSEQVALGQACTGPVDHLMKRVRMLRHYGVKPWVVLDGRRTPMKDDTGKQRQQEREKNLSMAKHFRRQAEDSSAGPEKDALLQKAQTFFQKSIHVTRQMVTNAMSALKREGVECMVSPYEADAQVAFLVKSDLASAVITEDSDILVYMAAVKSTAPVLYKMDEFGACKELGFDTEKLSSLPGVIGKFGRGLSIFSGEGGGRSFVQLAALAGCDYVDNIRGLGLLTALPIVTKFRRTLADKRVSHILMHVQKMGKTASDIPTGHRERMHLAEMSFFWHRVYDPRTKKCVHFCEAAPELMGTADVPALPSTAGGTAFLGEPIEDEMMVNISRGNVDPVTGETVISETFPALGAAGVRRAETHQPRPSCSGQRRSIVPSDRPRSATMPTTKPNGSKNQRNESRGASPFTQQGQKQGRDWRGREAQASAGKRGGSGGGGLLKDMFERARSRAEEEKENLFSQQKTRYPAPGLQDVSEIVLACGSGQTPGRRGRVADSSSTPTAAPNPFARKPGGSAAARAGAASFHTPDALTAADTRLRGDADALRPTAYGGGDPDVWSRLSKGCLTACARKDGGEDTCSVTRGAAHAVGEDHKDCGARRAAAAPSGAVSAAADFAGVTPAAPKRPLSRGVSGSSRGKKAKLGVGGKVGSPRKGATMLSFFGRVPAVSKR